MTAVAAIVLNGNDVLIGKKRSDSPKLLAGKWHIPGEGVENFESNISALERGIKEEAGLEIEVGKYLDSSITPRSKNELKWYECYSNSREVHPSSDLEDLMWVPKDKVLDYLDRDSIELMTDKIKNYFKGCF